MTTSNDTSATESLEAEKPSPDELFQALWAELRRIAAAYMKRQAPAHTLQTTALINEAYLKLAAKDGSRWSSRQHFLAEVTRAIRSILVDHARAKASKKRRPPGRRVALDVVIETLRKGAVDMLDLDEALEDLETCGKEGPEMARVAELRVLGGLSAPEISDALDVPQRTVERRWHRAQAWLRQRLG